MKPRRAAALALEPRILQLRRGLWLEAITVGWNAVEGVVAVVAGTLAGSVALLSFGIDSFVETTSGAVVGFRLLAETRNRSGDDDQRVEQVTSRIASALLIALAVYIAVESTHKLFGAGARPDESFLGIAVTGISIIVMPVLSRAKLRCADALGSAALRADAYETIACTWLSAATLVGLTANAALGWWWADPLAALAHIPLIVTEGWEGLLGSHHHQAD